MRAPLSRSSTGILVLVIALLWVYWPLSQAGFIDHFDDKQYVLENPHLQAGLSFKGIAWAFTSHYAANWHPLTWISHMLDVELFGLQPGGHHLVNLLLHTANTLLLLLLMQRVTGSFGQALWIAALFGLHPLHVESVAWIAERKDLLSTFLGFLSLLAWLRYVRTLATGAYLLALGLFGLGLLAKPMLVTLPFVLLLLDYWPLKRFSRPGPKWVLVEKLPWLVLSAGTVGMTLWAQGAWSAVISTHTLPLFIRVLNAGLTYLTYLVKMVWPARLAIFYAYPLQFPLAKGLSALLVFVLICTAVICCARRAPWIFTGWFWYAGTLIPVIGVVQVGMQSHADRYTYVPLIGIFMIIARAGAWLWARRPHLRAPLGVAALAACVLLGVRTRQQAETWQSSESLFAHAVKVTDRNYMAHNTYGVILLEKGRYQEALTHLTRASEYKPDLVRAHLNRGIAFEKMGDTTAARTSYARVLALQPDNWRAHNNMGLLFLRSGELKKAGRSLTRALYLNPQAWEVYSNLAILHPRLGDTTRALVCLDQALTFNPQAFSALLNRGHLRIHTGDMEAAQKDLAQALRLRPASVRALYGLALIAEKGNDIAGAVTMYKEVLKRFPQHGPTRRRLAALTRQEGE